jgi:hypothetical protein
MIIPLKMETRNVAALLGGRDPLVSNEGVQLTTELEAISLWKTSVNRFRGISQRGRR